MFDLNLSNDPYLWSLRCSSCFRTVLDNLFLLIVLFNQRPTNPLPYCLLSALTAAGRLVIRLPRTLAWGPGGPLTVERYDELTQRGLLTVENYKQSTHWETFDSSKIQTNNTQGIPDSSEIRTNNTQGIPDSIKIRKINTQGTPDSRKIRTINTGDPWQ